ncbi:RnfABCDGE type electron transport complex subunit D [Rhodoferax sp.]|uniref:RnfABCDGE type electron transport complex subunit D n=1 Tax=Rhodoferax sp. TaxID=50421 RepID=UPI00271CCA51|nr:RnfABCDGE type electron transport complex subunit D [Rhodoferax sp.]MDO8321269.1 RnfABCDGE type electron transport complex subunit D [Rhodoferax sp.]
MSTLASRAGPFTHTVNTVTRTMVWVILALVPGTAYGLWLYGWPAVMLFVITLATALASEAVMLMLLGQPVRSRLWDGSALLTGWLLAMSLPPWAPWWIGVLGSISAIVLGKHLFGGIGQNMFNPAMVARIVLLISFPVQLTMWVVPAPLGSAAAPTFSQSLALVSGQTPVPDHMSAATALGALKTELSRGVSAAKTSAQLPPPQQLAIGRESGSMGETSAGLLLAGGLLLLTLRIISWHIPVALLGTLGALAAISNALDPARFASMPIHLLSGAAVLGAFFIATDYVTSPVSRAGQLLFGAGIGALTWVIRALGGYPEGLAFAVVLMNALVPLIDRGFRPRVFGRSRRGKSLEAKTQPKIHI